MFGREARLALRSCRKLRQNAYTKLKRPKCSLILDACSPPNLPGDDVNTTTHHDASSGRPLEIKANRQTRDWPVHHHVIDVLGATRALLVVSRKSPVPEQS